MRKYNARFAGVSDQVKVKSNVYSSLALSQTF
jgi:hypothetical protein